MSLTEREMVEAVRHLVDLEQVGARLPTSFGPYTAYTVIGALQLACRHPEMGGSLQRMLRAFCDQLEEGLRQALRGNPAGTAAVDQLYRGWDASQDVPHG